MLEIHRAEDGTRVLRLFHGGWISVDSPQHGLQLTIATARLLATALSDWADGEDEE